MKTKPFPAEWAASHKISVAEAVGRPNLTKLSLLGHFCLLPFRLLILLNERLRSSSSRQSI